MGQTEALFKCSRYFRWLSQRSLPAINPGRAGDHEGSIMNPFKPLIAVWAVGTAVIFVVTIAANDIQALGYGLGAWHSIFALAVTALKRRGYDIT